MDNWDEIQRAMNIGREIEQAQRALDLANDPMRHARAVQDTLLDARELHMGIREAAEIQTAADLAGKMQAAYNPASIADVAREVEEQYRNLRSAEDLLEDLEVARKEAEEVARSGAVARVSQDALADVRRIRDVASAQSLLDPRALAGARDLLELSLRPLSAPLQGDYLQDLSDAATLASSADVRSLLENIEDPIALIEEAVRQARASGPLAEDEFAEIELYGVDSKQLITQAVEQSPTLLVIVLMLYLATIQAQSIPSFADQAEQLEKELGRLLNVLSALAGSMFLINLVRDSRHREGAGGGEPEPKS